MWRISLVLLAFLTASPAMGLQSSPDAGSTQGAGQANASPTAPKQSEDANASVANGIRSRIETDWRKYDVTGKGKLRFVEFSSWMNDLRAENGNGQADDTVMLTAFLVADTDQDKMVSRDELTTFMLTRNHVEAASNH